MNITKEITNGYNAVVDTVTKTSNTLVDYGTKTVDFVIDEVRAVPTIDLALFGVVGGVAKRRISELFSETPKTVAKPKKVSKKSAPKPKKKGKTITQEEAFAHNKAIDAAKAKSLASRANGRMLRDDECAGGDAFIPRTPNA